MKIGVIFGGLPQFGAQLDRWAKRDLPGEKQSSKKRRARAPQRKNATKAAIEHAGIGNEEFSCPQFFCPDSEVGQEDWGQENFPSRKSLGFHLGG